MYEARRRAACLNLPEGQVIVDQGQLDRLHTLEPALDDVEADLVGRPQEPDDRAALGHLPAAAGDLRGFLVEALVS
jgi:hypothetical protein